MGVEQRGQRRHTIRRNGEVIGVVVVTGGEPPSVDEVTLTGPEGEMLVLNKEPPQKTQGASSDGKDLGVVEKIKKGWRLTGVNNRGAPPERD